MEKILVIDDEAAFREMTVAALQAQGFETLEAENGRTGVHLAQEHLPDLILSDVQMGGFDGYAAVAALRYQSVTSTIPVILMTGAPDETGRRFAMEVGADDYLAKPFTIQELAAAVRIQLQKREAIMRQARSLKFSDRDEAELKALAEASASAASSPAMDGRLPPETSKTRAESAGAPAIATLISGIEVTAENVPLAVEIFWQMLQASHPTLGNLAQRSMALCQTLGPQMKLSPDELNDLLWASRLCDIGLVGVNQQIVRRWLRQPHNLPKEELIQIHEHPEQSCRLLEILPVFAKAGRIIRSHHEHWDGTGFPDGLKGAQIPLLARLLSAANYYCGRYEAHPIVCAELELQSNYMFDPCLSG